MRAVTWGANVGPDIRVFPAEVLKWYHSAAGTDDDQTNGDSEMLDVNSDLEEVGSTDEAQSSVPPRLADILPFFIQLTALRSAEDEEWHTTERWLRLAAEFMRQAVIERLLDRNNAGGADDSMIVETFAWGTEGSHKDEGEPDSKDENTVFLLADETPDQSTITWSKLRTRYLNELLPKDTSSIKGYDRLAVTRAHLDGLRKRHSLEAFEKQLLSFLEALDESYPRPVLSQLEADQDMTGASDEDDDADRIKNALIQNGEQIAPDEHKALRSILQGRAQ